MNATALLVFSVFMGALALHQGACGSSPEPCTGRERCGCYANQTCNGALLCVSNVCVNRSNSGTGAGGQSAGASGTAGVPGLGGQPGTAGAGNPGSGGAIGSGGVVPTGGAIGSGGVVPTGGAIGSGGVVPTGGAIGSGGVVPTGGTIGSGGVAGGPGGAGGNGGRGDKGGATPGGGAGGTSAAGGGGGAAGNGDGLGGMAGAPASDPDLVLWYPFDESSGSVANDASGFAGGPRNGALETAGTGTAVAFTSAHQVGTHAVQMSGNTTTGGYVRIPSLQTLAPNAVTLAMWINLTSANTGMPDAFSFASSDKTYMSLTVQPTTVHFQITTNMGTGIQGINSTSKGLSAASWHHVAVTLDAGSPYTGRLYIDGVLAASNTAMTVHPTDLGDTTARSYIGGFVLSGSMSYLNGAVDDFRVYRRALTAAEITALIAVR